MGLFLAGTGLTFLRAREWSSGPALLHSSAMRCPAHGGVARFTIHYVLLKESQFAEARAVASRVRIPAERLFLETYVDAAQALHEGNLARVREVGVRLFAAAPPEDRAVRTDIANLVMESGLYAEAESAYRALLAEAEDSGEIRYNLGLSLARQGRPAEAAGAIRREPCGWDELVVGMECGGSDALSGVTANPLVGTAADWLVDRGGTVILSETTEMIGTGAILSERAASPEVGKEVLDLVQGQTQFVKESLGPFADYVISPGNIEGGLTNITEKALGCIVKGGTSPIQEEVEYGEAPTRKGLVLMNTPGSDIFSLTGKAAGGAQIMIFTTGRGTPVGFPTVPVIKIASNTELYETMTDDMDVNAGRLLEGVSMEEAFRELIGLVGRVAEGEERRS